MLDVQISSISINVTTSVIEAMSIIDRGAAQIALVIDDQQRMIGALTDGDIRRGLLRGKTLESSVDEFMNRDFRFASSADDRSEILKMMRRDSLLQIPVLDPAGHVIDLLLLQELLSPVRQPNPVVIMAGGKGTRLRPYTEDCPKPMITVDGKPMLEILLERCISSGFHKFYFSVNYLKEQIIDYFSDGNRWGVSINYLVEDEPLGTAGSLSMLPTSIDSPFIVMNADVLTRLDLTQLLSFHCEHNARATLCAREHVINVPYGVVQAKGVELDCFEEKPSYRNLVNAGIYVIDPQLLSLLPHHQYIDMPTFLSKAQEVGDRVAVFPIHEYWLDIGRPETLKQANKEWSVGAYP